ncbi:MAG: hypothetical protein LBQ60_12015 [Bacteroidales bacterium]|jgi:hypothetical protein|nr:hypothetical protein [Bacteroidales bacterium]
MACNSNRNGERCPVYVGQTEYFGVCKDGECHTDPYISCENKQKGDPCNDYVKHNGYNVTLLGTCDSFFVPNLFPQLGCKAKNAGSGVGVDYQLDDNDHYCTGIGYTCTLPNDRGIGTCAYFYYGFGNYKIHCAVNDTGSGGSGDSGGSGSGWEDIDTICDNWLSCGPIPCNKNVSGYWRSGNCEYDSITRKCECKVSI